MTLCGPDASPCEVAARRGKVENVRLHSNETVLRCTGITFYVSDRTAFQYSHSYVKYMQNEFKSFGKG